MKEISLSVEETNKLRLSLGLKVLDQDEIKVSDTVNVPRKEEQQYIAEDHDSNADRVAQKVLKKRKTLGEGKEESAMDFLKKVGKKATKKTVTRTSTVAYDQKDLQGLKIAHNLEDLPQETILTLKDSIINDDDQEDQLENVQIKKPIKPKQYNVYEEYEREGLGLDKTVLGKYDSDEEQGFVLGKGGVKLNTTKQEDLYEKVANAKKGGISLDYKKVEMSDFQEPSFKKKKIKKMKKKNKGMELEDIQEQKEYREFENSNRNTDISSLNFVDDHDLQLALSKTRKKARAQNILETLEMQEEEILNDNQVVISDLTEFVETLSSVPLLKQNEIINHETTAAIDNSSNTLQQEEASRDQDPDVKMEIDIEDQAMNIDDQNKSESDSEPDDLNPAPTKGLAGTLSLLSSKGYLQPVAESYSRCTKSKEEILIDVQIKQEFLKYGNDRDWPRRLKELESQRERARIKRLETYKPTIELLHRDNTGRELTPKEAFKEFAQKFHGVKSGKKKVEKKLKRLKEELEMKKLDGDILVRVTGRAEGQEETKAEKPVKMEKGVIMELPAPGSKSAQTKRKNIKADESTPQTQTPQVSQAQIQAQEPALKHPSNSATSPKREKITFGFGKKKLAPKKLE